MEPRRRISDAQYQEFKAMVQDLLYDKNVLQVRGLVKWQHRLANYLGFHDHYERVKDKENYLQHTLRVAIEAYLYAQEHGGDPRTAARASILHDVGKTQGQYKRGWLRFIPFIGDGHAKYSAEYARETKEDKKVVDTIDSHMFPMRAYPPPRSSTERALWLADKKDAVRRDRETSKLAEGLYQEMVQRAEKSKTKKLVATLILLTLLPAFYLFFQKSSLTLQAVDVTYFSGISVLAIAAVISFLIFIFYQKRAK